MVDANSKATGEVFKTKATVTVSVTFDVERCEDYDTEDDPITADELGDSVRQAVDHAIRYGEMEGHVHPLEYVVSTIKSSSEVTRVVLET